MLTEIAKIDPAFDKHDWLRFCEKEIIPNILEAFIRCDLHVLEDWCYEIAYKAMEANVKDYQKVGYDTSASRVLDISKLEVCLVIIRRSQHSNAFYSLFLARCWNKARCS